MQKLKIVIADDFSEFPGPRTEEEGSHSGRLFRQTVLLPYIKQAIAENKILLVDLDGTRGYCPSFIEESFGGLIRYDGIDYEDIISHLEIKSDELPKYKIKALDDLLLASKNPVIGDKND